MSSTSKSYIDQINQINQIIELNDTEEVESIKNQMKNDSLEKIISDTQEALNQTNSSIEYSSFNEILANCHLIKNKEESKAAYHIIESKAVFLRQQILSRQLKSETRESVTKIPQSYGLKYSNVRFPKVSPSAYRDFKLRLKELPKEWDVLQISSRYNCYRERSTHSIHLVKIPTSDTQDQPYVVTLPKPKTESKYDVCNEIKSILDVYKSDLEFNYVNKKSYWIMREKHDTRMKTAVGEMERNWFREWRLLFVGEPIENLDTIEGLLKLLNQTIKSYKKSKTITKRMKWFLKKIILGAGFLTKEEIVRAVIYILPNHETLARGIIDLVNQERESIDSLKNARRKTLILIVDENLDYLPFEAMDILKGHPVTRFPSLHVAYALFKEHEKNMKQGCVAIEYKEDLGTSIVNPASNLERMEKRMKILIQQWLPKWKSIYNVPPDVEFFKQALCKSDVMMFNGHGSGIQYLTGAQIEKLEVRSMVLLFGCSSLKLFNAGGRFPPFGISNQYLIAKSPHMLGMLWEVTDADTDRMTSHFIINWISSAGNKSWAEFDVDEWLKGILKFKDIEKPLDSEGESEVLRMVAKSKQICLQFMNTAAIINRGLPVILEFPS